MRLWRAFLAMLVLGCPAAPEPPPRASQPASPPAAEPAPPPPDTEPPPVAASLQQRRSHILALINEPRCERVEQCRAMPLGAKPCGGPRSYIVFSTVTTDSSRLHAAVAEYTALQAEENRRTGAFSDCAVVPRPAVSCSEGRCVSR